MAFLQASLAVILISLLSLSGLVFYLFNKGERNRLNIALVSLAAGALIGDAFIHLIPEGFENEGSDLISLTIILGLLFFFVLENLIHWRHCHIEDSKTHLHTFAITNLVGDAMHNLIDGFIIGISFISGSTVGFSAALAIALHEIPQEIGDFGVLIHAGLSRRKAILLNLCTALVAVLGLFLAFLIQDISPELVTYSLTFAAGGFIYIAVADLIPEIRHPGTIAGTLHQITFMLIGIVFMILLKFVG